MTDSRGIEVLAWCCLDTLNAKPREEPHSISPDPFMCAACGRRVDYIKGKGWVYSAESTDPNKGSHAR
jgi:hypothetical protein